MMPIRIFDTPEKNLETAMIAADKAATFIRSFHRENKKLEIELKGHNDLVTQADVGSEKIIKEVIGNAFPDDLFLAEESYDFTELTDQRTWIIDPIDGTTNFAHGFPVYCISIALYENKQPVTALVLEAAKSELFTASKGNGAFLNGRPIHISSINQPEKSLLATGFPYRDLGLLDDYLNLFKTLIKETHGVRRPGSAAYDLACVAAGRFEGFYEYGLSPWDVAAGVLLIQEAGGKVSDWMGTDDYLFGKRIVAGNDAVHAYLLHQIQTHFKPEQLR